MTNYYINRLLEINLSSNELTALKSLLTIENSEERLLKLKAFFLRENIFETLTQFVDPMYVANELCVNNKHYGF